MKDHICEIDAEVRKLCDVVLMTLSVPNPSSNLPIL
jgi:hypothetical protein